VVSESAANGFGRKVRRCTVGWQRCCETWESGRIALGVAMMRRGKRGRDWKKKPKILSPWYHYWRYIEAQHDHLEVIDHLSR
jgi:hypothetical protein